MRDLNIDKARHSFYHRLSLSFFLFRLVIRTRCVSHCRWDGCQVSIRNTTPSYCAEYQSYWTWPKPKEDTKDALVEILDNFQRNEWQLALLYYEAVDATGFYYFYFCSAFELLFLNVFSDHTLVVIINQCVSKTDNCLSLSLRL